MFSDRSIDKDDTADDNLKGQIVERIQDQHPEDLRFAVSPAMPSKDKDDPNISKDENRSTTNFQYKASVTDAVHPLLDYSRVSKLKEGS